MTLTKDETNEFSYLLDTVFYRIRGKGAGYRKYTIQKILKLPDLSISQDLYKKSSVRKWLDRDVMLEVRGTHFREKSKSEIMIGKLYYDEKMKKYTINTRFFSSVIEFFLKIESAKILAYRKLRQSKQYKFELNQIKAKYPEYFL
jgi:hypothetical protein